MALEAADQGQCPIESRSVLASQVVRGDECISQYFALNDVVVNKSAISRLMEFDLYIDENFVFQYKADGVIIATPTGSTAYSLAAGGPVMMPSVSAFVVTPVCPHSLTHRPLVVTDKSQIELRVETGDEQAFLSIDGQVGLPVHQGDRVVCCRAGLSIHLQVSSYRATRSVPRFRTFWSRRSVLPGPGSCYAGTGNNTIGRPPRKWRRRIDWVAWSSPMASEDRPSRSQTQSANAPVTR